MVSIPVSVSPLASLRIGSATLAWPYQPIGHRGPTHRQSQAFPPAPGHLSVPRVDAVAG